MWANAKRDAGMRVHRSELSGGFTQIPNAALRDSRLSWKARGLLAYLLSHVDDGWTVDARRLAQEGPDGRIAILAGLNELVEAGYIVRTKHRTKGGHILTEMDVWDVPQQIEAEPGSGNLTPVAVDNETPQPVDKPSYPQGQNGTETDSRGNTGIRLTDAGKPDPYRRPPKNTTDLNRGGTLPPHPLRQDPPTSDLNEHDNSIITDITQHREQHGNLRPRAIGRARVPPPNCTAETIHFPSPDRTPDALP